MFDSSLQYEPIIAARSLTRWQGLAGVTETYPNGERSSAGSRVPRADEGPLGCSEGCLLDSGE